MLDNEIQAEANVLGALLISKNQAEDFVNAKAVIHPEDFASEIYAAVFKAMEIAAEQDGGFTKSTVFEKSVGEVQKLGVSHDELSKMLVELEYITPTAANLMLDVRAVKRNSKRRKLLELSRQIQDDAEGGGDPDEISASVQSQLDNLLGEATGSGGVHNISDATTSFLDFRSMVELGQRLTIPTGIEGLDKQLGGGFRRRTLNILGARPSIGKSAVALNIAENVSASGTNVLYVSLEMGKEELVARMIARQAKINSGFLTSAQKYGEKNWRIVAEAIADMNSLPIAIDDRDSNTVAGIEAEARKLQNLGLVVIDYLGLLDPPDKKMTTLDAVTANSRSLKKLSKRLDVPVLLLCQLNRSSVKEGRRPTMSDLRDSGAIEQDADVVMLLSQGVYEGELPKNTSPLICDVVKNRSGECGAVNLWFEKSICEIA